MKLGRRKFDIIVHEAEVKLRDAAIDSLRRDVEANQDDLREREEDIDGTIAQWKTHLARNKEIPSEQADTLVQTAIAFFSSHNAVIQASKALQAEITAKVHINRQRVIPNHRGQIPLNRLTILARPAKDTQGKGSSPAK